MSENKIKGRKGNGHRGKERRKGTGTLEKRGNVYIARWTVDGKRYAQSTGTADKREAEAKLEEFTAPFRLKDKAERLEAFAGKLGGVQARIKDFEEARPAMKLADAWGAFLKSPNRKDTAGAARLRICEGWTNRLVAFMAKNYPDISEVRGIGKEQAHKYAAEGFEDCGNSTRNQAISFYRMMWRVLIADGAARITGNPWDGIQKKHETHTRRREMTVEELARVAALLNGQMRDLLNGQMRLLFFVGVYTGQRLGDCAMLEWGQVDLVRRRISLIPRKTARKTGRMVVIPLHTNLMNMLLSFPAAERRGFVMPLCAKMYQDESQKLSESFMRVLRAAGIETATDGADGCRKRPLVSFHSLRHTFVSLAANAGIPLAIVQSIVGHSTVEMTRHYFHESDAALNSAVAALPDLLGGKPDGAGEVSARVRSICAMVAELTAEERAELLRQLNGAADRKPDAGTVAALPCPAAGVPAQERQADNGAAQSAAA